MRKIIIISIFILLLIPAISFADIKYIDSDDYNDYYIDMSSIERTKDYVSINLIVEPHDYRGMMEFREKVEGKIISVIPDYTIFVLAFTYDKLQMRTIMILGYESNGELVYRKTQPVVWNRVKPHDMFGKIANHVVRNRFLNFIYKIIDVYSSRMHRN